MKEADAIKIASSDEAFKLHMVTSTVRMETMMENVCGRVKSLETEQILQGKAVVALQVKSGVWGLLGGLIAGILAVLGFKAAG